MGLISSCFFVFRSYTQKLDLFFFLFFLRIYFDLSFSLSFFALLSFLNPVLLPNLSSFFCIKFWLAIFFLERDKFNLQRVNQNWQWIFPKMFLGFLYVTLSGLVRVSITRCRWKDLSLLTLLLTVSYMRKENMHRSIETKTTKAVPHLKRRLPFITETAPPSYVRPQRV